jgi:hypothetical protein
MSCGFRPSVTGFIVWDELMSGGDKVLWLLGVCSPEIDVDGLGRVLRCATESGRSNVRRRIMWC